ncbi:hypothetical protein [Paenibacillus sp. TC-CSREp1]|uniref:hypothetical protein n=1 Tax=Paenibacillus sp. TC-CSREp1 TaxID=3410089 RepID=UPI003CF8CF8C
MNPRIYLVVRCIPTNIQLLSDLMEAGSFHLLHPEQWPPSVKTIGWSYEGATTDEQRGGVGYNFYELIVGHFKLNVVYDVQNNYPRIWLKGWSNGTYDYSIGL